MTSVLYYGIILTMRIYKVTPLRERFWKHVNKTDTCWLWTGAHLTKGYGVIGRGPGLGNALTHRVSWEIHFGPIPENMLVCHHCDNPACINPAHLFLGTHLTNAADMCTKDRQARGERCRPKHSPAGDEHWSHRKPKLVRRGEAHHNARLSEAQVKLIRQKRAQGIVPRILAQEFGVSPRTIRKIVQGTRWSHVD